MRRHVKEPRPTSAALRIVTALLLSQGVIRGGIAIYLWVTFPAAASDRAGVIAAFVLGWVPLTFLNVVTAAGIARRKSWAPLSGLAVCGIGALIDACFMFMTVGYWTSEASPDWVFFDLVLWTSSTAYVVVYIISLIYLYRGYREELRIA
ncbi:MAG: hypothetical protein WBF58_16655 [Xanthobacteraceae bacterium]